MPKNAEISWSNFNSGGQTMDEVHAAFKYRKAEIRCLPAGLKICRLHAYSNIAPGTTEASIITSWWSPYDPYDWDAGIEERMKLAGHFGVTTRELSRIVMAVKEDWNSLAYLWVATLVSPINVFFGIVAGQARMSEGGVSKRGGGEASSGSKNLAGNNAQFFVPNFAFGDIRNSQFLPL
ncbi:MAG TPA: hypothetical protein VFW00_11890 [Rhodocyclaceae bacterium]|nr:hypothetical protein [Rhodocyclaceae bacterium]